MDRNWDKDKFKSEDLDRTVKHIHICAYINEHNEGDQGDPPTNHWATFLEISKTHSVRMDMAPGYGSDGQRGKIEISSKRYRYTDKAIHMLSFDPIGGTTVKNIVDLIQSNGRQKYNFTPEWEGCRYWVYTIISDLEEAGILEPGSGMTAWSAVSYYFANPSGYEPREVRQGTFRSSE
ncbi:hypothetical protein MAJ_07958, partial [Metarhizium majus ARSEF 297]